ncbi:MAG: hypothetical protein AAF197_06750 [Pseudomonadota bacterium]
MLLRRVTQHVKAQNWFAVFLDFIVVVAGIWFALIAGQWVEDRQARIDLDRAERDLNFEMRDSYYYAYERLAIASCRKARYQSLGEMLLTQEASWPGSPGNYGDGLLSYDRVFAPVLHSSERPWASTIWDAELAKGTFDIMDVNKRQLLTDFYSTIKEMDVLQGTVYAMESRLQALAHPLNLTTSDKLKYYDVLGQADAQSALLELAAQYVIDNVEEKQGMLEFLAEQNVSRVGIYGNCAKPMELPLLNSKSNPEIKN